MKVVEGDGEKIVVNELRGQASQPIIHSVLGLDKEGEDKSGAMRNRVIEIGHGKVSAEALQQARELHQRAVNEVLQQLTVDKLSISIPQAHISIPQAHISHISIPQNKLSSAFLNSMQQVEQHQTVRRRREIIRKKQMLLTELHEIDHLEEDCSRVRLLTHKKEFVKSQEEDDRVVKEVLRRQKMFQERLRRLEIELVQRTQKQRLAEEQKRQETKERLRQMRRLQKSASLQQLKQKQQERSRQMAQENVSYQRVRKQHYLFQELAERWSSVEQRQKREFQKLLEDNRRQKREEIARLKEHQQHYETIMADKENRRRLANDSKLLDKGNLSKRGKQQVYKYMKLCEKEQQAQRLEREELIKLSKMNLAKRREYAKNVRELAKNSLRVKESAIVEERRTPSAFVLDMAALYEHGNAYMKEGNRHIAKQGQRIVPSVLNPKDTSIDYLKERRLRNGQTKEDGLARLERILEDDKLEIEDKMRKAMGFAQKYECKETGSAEMICRSVQAKIRILRQLSPYK